MSIELITYSGAADGCRGFNRGNGFSYGPVHNGEPDIADLFTAECVSL